MFGLSFRLRHLIRLPFDFIYSYTVPMLLPLKSDKNIKLPYLTLYSSVLKTSETSLTMSSFYLPNQFFMLTLSSLIFNKYDHI